MEKPCNNCQHRSKDAHRREGAKFQYAFQQRWGIRRACSICTARDTGSEPEHAPKHEGQWHTKKDCEDMWRSCQLACIVKVQELQAEEIIKSIRINCNIDRKPTAARPPD